MDKYDDEIRRKWMIQNKGKNIEKYIVPKLPVSNGYIKIHQRQFTAYSHYNVKMFTRYMCSVDKTGILMEYF